MKGRVRMFWLWEPEKTFLEEWAFDLRERCKCCDTKWRNEYGEEY